MIVDREYSKVSRSFIRLFVLYYFYAKHVSTFLPVQSKVKVKFKVKDKFKFKVSYL